MRLVTHCRKPEVQYTDLTVYNVPCIQKEFHECRISQLITIRSYKKQTMMIENSWKRYSSLLVGKYLVGKQPDSYFHKKLGLYFCMVHKTEDLQFFAEFHLLQTLDECSCSTYIEINAILLRCRVSQIIYYLSFKTNDRKRQKS